MDNYPPGMNWGAFDDYQNPALECGHRSDDGCDCWCDGGEGVGETHQVGDCDSEICTHLQCESCFRPHEDEEWLVNNLQRANEEGTLLWVDKQKTKPLRFLPQHSKLTVRLCGKCYKEYSVERKEGAIQ
jgi:hypothetical protein